MNDYSDLVFMMGAMVLFSLFTNNANDTMVRSSTLLTQVEVEYSAIAFAQGIVDEARSRAFDEVTVAPDPDDQSIVGNLALLGGGGIPNSFTAVGNIGPDTGEAYPNFDDFDDYDGLSIIRTTGYGDITITATVFYVTEVNVVANAGARTTMKRLNVTATHPDLANPITIAYVKTYF
jgi:hypothetical protein